MKKADIGVAAYVLAAFIMFIVPVPSGLLDVLLACNMAVAFSVMFGCMFAKEALDMSYFPTILLFTTIFRISLNVSSTRLILTSGDPGQVVRTFGEYVGGNDLIIGGIVFIILIQTSSIPVAMVLHLLRISLSILMIPITIRRGGKWIISLPSIPAYTEQEWTPRAI